MTGNPGDLWSGQARGWQRRHGGGGGPVGRWLLLALVAGATLMAIAVTPVLAEDAPDPCIALERRVAGILPAAGRLRGFGETGRYGRAGAEQRLGLLPTVVGCTAAWWQVAAVPGAAPGWFAVMR